MGQSSFFKKAWQGISSIGRIPREVARVAKQAGGAVKHTAKSIVSPEALASGAAGAGAGSMFGPVGTAAGGTIGTLIGALSKSQKLKQRRAGGGGRGGFSDAMLGTDAQRLTQPILQPDQVEAQQQMLQSIMSKMGEAYDFEPFREATMRRFNERTVPDLARPFSGVGSGSAKDFGAFYTNLAQTRGALEANLGLLKPQFAQRQIQQLLPYVFQQRNQYQNLPGQQGLGQGLAQNLLPSLIQSAPQLLGLLSGRNNTQGQNLGLDQLPRQGTPPVGGNEPFGTGMVGF